MNFVHVKLNGEVFPKPSEQQFENCLMHVMIFTFGSSKKS
jgi:hypothetical protein